jgi:hypothetical protein
MRIVSVAVPRGSESPGGKPPRRRRRRGRRRGACRESCNKLPRECSCSTNNYSAPRRRILQNTKSCGSSAPRCHKSPSRGRLTKEQPKQTSKQKSERLTEEVKKGQQVGLRAGRHPLRLGGEIANRIRRPRAWKRKNPMILTRLLRQCVTAHRRTRTRKN